MPHELKQALRKQAERAGLSLLEWVRMRLELEGTDPDEMRALLTELANLGKKLEHSDAGFYATMKRRDADERKRPARLAKAAREGRELVEQMDREGRTPLSLGPERSG